MKFPWATGVRGLTCEPSRRLAVFDRKKFDDGCDFAVSSPISPSGYAFLQVLGRGFRSGVLPDSRFRNFGTVPYVFGVSNANWGGRSCVGTRYDQALTLGTEIDFTATVFGHGPDVTGGTSSKEPGR